MKDLVIDLKTNTIAEKADLFSHDNRSTTLTVDYRGCGVDGWDKFVDFEMADGTVARMDFGVGEFSSEEILNQMTVEGELKINPIARQTIDTEHVRQRAFKTFVVKVQKTIDAYGNDTAEFTDIILPILARLDALEDYDGVQDTIISLIEDEQVVQNNRIRTNEEYIEFLLSGGAEVPIRDPQTTINTENIATNTADIATNALSIATNAINIALNTADIETNSASIDLLIEADALINTMLGTLQGEIGTVDGRVTTLHNATSDRIDALNMVVGTGSNPNNTELPLLYTTHPNNPTNSAHFIITNLDIGGVNGHQIAVSHTTRQVYSRTRNSGGWNTWLEISDADRVIELGSNTFGEWEKWASGKLVMRDYVNRNMNVTTPYGSGFYGSLVPGSITYPTQFVGDPALIHFRPFLADNDMTSAIGSTNGTVGSSPSVYIYSFASKVKTVRIYWEAVGRWKA